MTYNKKTFRLFLSESENINENSHGNPIASTPEALKNFWDWFGGSKSVDNEGRPKVVYHNTTKKFDIFKPGINGGLGGNGIYFSEFPQSQFGNVVMKVYLKIINPITNKSELPGMRELNSSGYPTRYIKNIFDMFSEFDGITNRSEYVVKDPSQIKSVDNNTFLSTLNIYK